MERLFLKVNLISLRCRESPLSVKSRDGSSMSLLRVMSGCCLILSFDLLVLFGG
jgi:hypothetical protein